MENTESNTQTNKQDQTKIGKQSSKSVLRVRKETKRKIGAVLQIINKKELGDKVSLDQVLVYAVENLQPDDISSLQAASFSNRDRLEIKYRDYCTANGRISMDEFLGLLLKDRNI